MKPVRLRASISLAVFITSICFLSAGDKNDLKVVGTKPQANAAAIDRGTSITVDFDRPIDVDTVNPDTFSIFGRLSGAASGTFSFTKGNRQVIFTPRSPFFVGEVVEVALSHDIADAAGVTLRRAGYAWSFWVQSGKSELNFKKAGRLDVGTKVRSYGGVGADLNGDGLPDIAIVNEDAATMSVFLNEGEGAFGKMSEYPMRLGVSPNAVSDFNKDGVIDLATANADDDSVSVLLGIGDGSFDSQVIYPVGKMPEGIAVLDANGDGFMDIVVCNLITADLSLLINNGDGTFAPERRFFSTPGAQFHGLATADMNGDGIPDLVVGAQGSRRIYVLLGRGDGTFTQSSFQNALGEPWVLRTGDLNGDGYVDVAVVSLAQGNLVILFGDGDGNLSEPTSYSLGAGLASVSLGDLDGDGSLDVVTSNFGAGTFTVFTNEGTGRLTPRVILHARGGPSCAILHDFDGDGTLDISAVDELEDEVVLWENM
jgi:hypothetical protein